MLVFWKAKLVLLAVPKTGSTALEAAFGPWADAAFLNPPRLKHMTCAAIAGRSHRFSNRTAAAGADGGHARAGGLAVELVSLPQPARAGGTQPQSTAGMFRRPSSRPGCRTIRRNTRRSAGSPGSCRSPRRHRGRSSLFRYDRMEDGAGFPRTTAFRRGLGWTGSTPPPPRGRHDFPIDADTRALLRSGRPRTSRCGTISAPPGA
jgi:hypothetical protein